MHTTRHPVRSSELPFPEAPNLSAIVLRHRHGARAHRLVLAIVATGLLGLML